MPEKIVVIGGGGHAKVIISVLNRIKKYHVVGYTDSENKGELLKVPFLGNDSQLKKLYENGVNKAVIGIGQIKSALLRRNLFDLLINIGFDLPAIIATSATVNEGVEVGIGTVIMDGVVVNCGTKIGSCSIINTHSSVDHDCEIGSFSHIAPGVTISGNVIIGNNVLIGTGASVIHSIKIISDSIIASGSSVQKSINKAGIYRGVPARMIKELT